MVQYRVFVNYLLEVVNIGRYFSKDCSEAFILMTCGKSTISFMPQRCSWIMWWTFRAVSWLKIPLITCSKVSAGLWTLFVLFESKSRPYKKGKECFSSWKLMKTPCQIVLCSVCRACGKKKATHAGCNPDPNVTSWLLTNSRIRAFITTDGVECVFN